MFRGLGVGFRVEDGSRVLAVHLWSHLLGGPPGISRVVGPLMIILAAILFMTLLGGPFRHACRSSVAHQ